MSASEAAAQADVIVTLVPDELQSLIYREQLAPAMNRGVALGIAHGFNIHYGLIRTRKDIDAFMVAPKAPGHTVRWEYARGITGFIVVSGRARAEVLAEDPNAQKVAAYYETADAAKLDDISPVSHVCTDSVPTFVA